MQPRVLIAHGNTQSLRRAVQALQGLGFDVIATPDGGDAFARFFEAAPALVVCSVSLPSLSGPNFARMVRSQSPETPVVLLRDTDPGSIEGEDEQIYVLGDPLDVNELRRAVPHLIPSPAEDNEFEDDGPSTAGVFILAALKRFQRSNNLLALLDEAGIHKMARIAQTQVHDDGSVIIKQGDIGDGFYFLVEGQVRVTLAEKNDAEVARINAGGFFGEMALLNDRPRSASVSTVGPCTLLWFERDTFIPMLDEYSVMREVLSGVADKRTEENLWRVLFDDTEVTKSLENIGSDSLLDDDLVNAEIDSPTKSVVEEITRRVERKADPDPEPVLEMPPEPETPPEPELPAEPVLPPEPTPAPRSDAPIAFEDDSVEASFSEDREEGMELPPEPQVAESYDVEPEPEISVALDESIVVHQPQNPQELATHAGRVFEANADHSEPIVSHSPWMNDEEEAKQDRADSGEVDTPDEPARADSDDAWDDEIDVDVADFDAEASPLPAPPGATAAPMAPRRFFGLSFAAGLIAGIAGGIVGSYFMVRSLLPPGLLEGIGDRTPVAGVPDDPTPIAPPTALAGDDGPRTAGDAKPTADGGPTPGDSQPPGDASSTTPQPDETAEPSLPDGPEPEGTEDGPPEGSPAAELSEEQQEERKKLRRSLFYLAGQSKYSQAMRVGRRMQEGFPMDWESLLKLADMERLSGETAGALDTYTAFLSAYPTNLFADEARLGKAQALISMKRYGEAKRLLKRVAAGEDMERAVKANAILGTISGP